MQIVPPGGSSISTPAAGTGINGGTAGPGSTNYVAPSNGDSANIALPGGTSATVVCGLYTPVSISGRAFIDQNADGVQQTGDTGVSGATVTLWDSFGPLYTATTAADGTYSFTGLKPGSYTVHFGTPSGDTITSEHVGTNAAVDSDINTAGVTNTITLTSGQAAVNVDAGYFATGSIAGIAFLDTNNDGIYGAGESGISGVTVTLYNGTTVVATTTSGAGGAYSFAGIAPGTAYSVKFTTPSGDTIAKQTAETTANPDASVVSATTGQTAAITVTSGLAVGHVDAGYVPPVVVVPGTITGIAFLDVGGDGALSTGDTGVSGVTVTLYNGTTVVATTTSAADGSYTFAGVAPGTAYSVKFGTRTGDVFTKQTAETTTVPDASIVNATTGQTATFAVAAGQTVAHVDAGYKAISPGTVTGIAFYDTNGDGILGTGETGISGVTVTLYNGTTVAATTTSGVGGTYSFTNVAPGSAYSVKFATPAGDILTKQTAETTAAPDASIVSATTGQTAAFAVASGQTVAHVDAGVYAPGSIGNYVWFDANKNGAQDVGETGVSGVTVKLLNGTGTTTLATTTTGVGGTYSFNTLAAGTFEVQFVAPAGDVFTVANALGGGTGGDSNANVTTGITTPITLTAGQSNLTIDAGLIKSSAGPSIIINKTADKSVVCDGGNVTYTFKVTNNGTQALTDVKVTDNIGTNTSTCYQQPKATTINGYNVGDTNHDGILGVGETWTYSLTVTEHADTKSVLTTSGCRSWYTCTPVDTTVVDHATVTAQSICSSNTSSGSCNHSGYGFDDYGNRCGFNYSTTDCRGDYFDNKGSLVYSDCNSSGYSKSYEFTGRFDDGAGNNTNCGYNYGNWNTWNCTGYGYTGCSTSGSYDDRGNCDGNTSKNCGFGSFDNYSSCGYGPTGSTGCTTGTTGGCTPVTVTATDSASVEVLACGTKVGTTCGTTGDLRTCYGQAEKVEFTYNACDTVGSKAISEGCGTVTGHNGSSCAFIHVSNCNDPHAAGGQTLFEGTVCNGDKFYADATRDLNNCAVTGANSVFSTSCKTYAFIYNSEADFKAGYSATQTICIDTTGAHAVSANDQFGSLQVCGYVGNTGKGFACA